MSLKHCLGDILNSPAREALCLGGADTLDRAVNALAVAGASAVLIARDEELEGIVTRGDLLRCMGRQRTGEGGLGRRLEEIMSAPVITADPADTIAEALKMMAGNGIKHLPLRDAGIKTIILHLTDLLGCKADLFQAEAEHLRDYIDHLHDAGKD